MSLSLPPLLALGAVLAIAMTFPGSAPPHTDLVVLEKSLIPVSSGVSVTVYEQTGEVGEYTFLEDVLMADGGTFSTLAILSENYVATSDGVYVTISCERIPPEPLEGVDTGNNIVAAKLNGVRGYPDGIWASAIVGYVIGTGGVEESIWNAIGAVDQVGPYGGSQCTYLGDYYSEITLAFVVTNADAIEATVDFDMDSFNLGSKGKWIQVYIELPAGHDVADIVISSVIVNRAVMAYEKPSEIGDHDADGIPDLMLKFDRASVASTLQVGQEVQVIVSGSLSDATQFEGADNIRVISPP
jgi:hypothetical protein